MYAPHTPERYAIPGASHCIFRLMQGQGDAQAWNLYWLSRADTDFMLSHSSSWFQHFRSLSPEQTEAFYAALDTPVVGRLTLATVVSQPPFEAMRLLRSAQLERCAYFDLADGELWRQTMLGRLFLAQRQHSAAPAASAQDADVIWIDFVRHSQPLKTADGAKR